MAVRCAAVFLLLSFILPKSVEADLITHFNFNNYDGDSAIISADSGTGLIILEEEGTAWPAEELDVAAGTDVNAVAPDPAGTALSLDNNGDETLTRTLTFEIDTTGQAISCSARRWLGRIQRMTRASSHTLSTEQHSPTPRFPSIRPQPAPSSCTPWI